MMWHELIWNVDFLRGLIFIAIGILAAILLIPRILERLQAQRDKRLAKALLRQWGHTCISAITALKPNIDTEQAEQIIEHLWENIRNGQMEPGGSAMIINNALAKELYSDEERKNEELPPEKKYPFLSSQAVLRSWLRRILNPMYAKIEIFDVELLPIGELEMAMSYVDSFSQQGYFTRSQFMSCALHLAQSMEKFVKYLWKLQGWANRVVIEEQEESSKSKAGLFFGIAVALFAIFVMTPDKISQVLLCATGVFFGVSSIILRINSKATGRARKWLHRLGVDYLAIFLSLVSVVIILLQLDQGIPAVVVFIVALILLIVAILRALNIIKRKTNNKAKSDN